MCGNTKTPMVVKAFPFEHPVITTKPSELKALEETEKKREEEPLNEPSR
jgi:hypothetical protein